MPRRDTSDPWERIFTASFACFVIAASAGAWFRIGTLHGFGGLHPGNLRHAHSHLMLMGWATPAMFAVMAAHAADHGRALGRVARSAAWSSLGFAGLAFFAFARWGYSSTEVGSSQLPLAAVISSFAMLSWYVVVGAWYRAMRGVPRTASLRLWDAAASYLVVASLGAWGLAFTMVRGVSNPFWPQATLHLFVDLFGDGWLLLGLLALLSSRLDAPSALDTLVSVLVLSLLPVFVLGIDANLVSPALRALGHTGIGIAGTALIAIVYVLRDQSKVPGTPWPAVQSLLALRGLAMLIAAWPPALEVALSSGARVIYLHLSFVGVLTPVLYLVASERWTRSRWAGSDLVFASSVLVVLSLFLLTPAWPRRLGGIWVLSAVSAAAVIVTATGGGLLVLRLWPRGRSAPQRSGR